MVTHYRLIQTESCFACTLSDANAIANSIGGLCTSQDLHKTLFLQIKLLGLKKINFKKKKKPCHSFK